MFRFISNNILYPRIGYSTVTPHRPSLMVMRYFSSDSANNPHSFTLSYLTKTCGLSPESALSACKTVRFESSEQPDAVLSFFEKLGFSKPHVSEMIIKFPYMLHCHPEETISPRVEFIRSIGASTPELVRIFTVNPWILERSLENQLVRTYNLLISMFQLDDKAAVELIKRNIWVLTTSPETGLISNINTLTQSGVPASNILGLSLYKLVCITRNAVQFGEIVKEVKEMGFDPLKSQFVDAIMVLTGLSKSKRDQKVEIYKRWGWSDKDIATAFKKFPQCMGYSEDKIMAAMDFYVNKVGLESSVIVNRPGLLGYSLKNKLVPRAAVFQYLRSNGLVKLNSSKTKVFRCTEKHFFEKYVECHEEAAHLFKLYNQNLILSDTEKSGKDEE